jgi:hypothetical protein
MAGPMYCHWPGTRRGHEEVIMTILHRRARVAGGHPGRAAAAALAAAAVLTVVIAGCAASSGSGPGSAPVASLPSRPSGTHGAGQTLTENQSDRDMVNFTRCMRQHGVAMSDPFHRAGHAGLSIDMPAQDSATRPAYAACTHFIQPIIQMKQAGAVAQAALDLPVLTRYAECMRSHDINMLDPKPDGELNLGTVPGISSDFGRFSPQFRAADSACRHLLPAGIADNGTGP